MTSINAGLASATIANTLCTFTCGCTTPHEKEATDPDTHSGAYCSHKETWDRKTRIAAYAITARSFHLPIRHLYAEASWEDIFGECVPAHIELIALMAGELAVCDFQEDAAEEIVDEVFYDVDGLLPDLWEEYDEAAETALTKLKEAFWHAAKRLIFQNRYVVEAIRAMLDSDLVDAQADQVVDIAMLALKRAIKDLEHATAECCD